MINPVLTLMVCSGAKPPADLVRMSCMAEIGTASAVWIQLLPDGVTHTGQGSFTVNAQAGELIVADFMARTNRMVVDYEHQTLGGGEAPAAGWIEGIEYRPGSGIWGRVQWTDRARQYIRAGEYRYISPVFFTRPADGLAVRLVNAGITNQPAIDGMEPLVAKQSTGGAAPAQEVQSMPTWLLELLGLVEGASEQEQKEAAFAMKQKLEDTRKALAASHAMVCKAIGLPETTTVQELELRLVAMKDTFTRVTGVLGMEGASASAIEGTLMAMKQGGDQTAQLAGRVKQLEDEARQREAADLVSMAMKEGKLTPAQEPWARQYAGRDPEGFRAFVAKAMVVVPQSGPEGVTPPSGSEANSPEFLQVCKAMGVNPAKAAQVGRTQTGAAVRTNPDQGGA